MEAISLHANIYITVNNSERKAGVISVILFNEVLANTSLTNTVRTSSARTSTASTSTDSISTASSNHPAAFPESRLIPGISPQLRFLFHRGHLIHILSRLCKCRSRHAHILPLSRIYPGTESLRMDGFAIP